jgi:ADP-heptose:LPS heptosyltransferase
MAPENRSLRGANEGREGPATLHLAIFFRFRKSHVMPHPAENPNLVRRPALGFLARVAAALSGLPLRLLRREKPATDDRLTVFACYMVGDFFMALPALRKLAAALPIQVVCRPDCASFVRDLGVPAVPFANAFFLERNLSSFFRTWPRAWRLREAVGGTVALDFDADPRTGFWMKVAGARRTVSYDRAHAEFFDELLPLPEHGVHQATRDLLIAGTFVERNAPPGAALPPPLEAADVAPGAPWMISCWTRRDVKNWPLASWDVFLQGLAARGVPFQVLDAPDAGAEFEAFRARWSGRARFLRAPLAEIAEAVRRAPGVIATDNFLGHMAAYFGKPVLWINGSSDPLHVRPLGPATTLVQYEPMPCRPCGHRCVNPEYKACLRRLSPEAVESAFEARLPRVRTLNPEPA